LSKEDQLIFVAHLAEGRLRKAISMVADGALRCGIREAPAWIASGRVKIKSHPSGHARVEFQPQRIPPNIGVILSYALASKVSRSEMVRVLRKGGSIKMWNMREPVEMPRLSMRDINDTLRLWPYKSRAGNPGLAKK
jgi:hypothetical protein